MKTSIICFLILCLFASMQPTNCNCRLKMVVKKGKKVLYTSIGTWRKEYHNPAITGVIDGKRLTYDTIRYSITTTK
jgi:hypothetical protein